MKLSLLFNPAVRADETNRARFEVNNLLCLALAAAFLGTGIAKVVATDFVIQTFGDSSLAPALLVAIGLVELAAAVFTIIPTTRLLGTGLISIVMLGAIGYHTLRGESQMVIVPLTALLVAMTSLFLEIRMRRDEEPEIVPVPTR